MKAQAYQRSSGHTSTGRSSLIIHLAAVAVLGMGFVVTRAMGNERERATVFFCALIAALVLMGWSYVLAVRSLFYEHEPSTSALTVLLIGTIELLSALIWLQG
jgi:hypothetical protein